MSKLQSIERNLKVRLGITLFFDALISYAIFESLDLVLAESSNIFFQWLYWRLDICFFLLFAASSVLIFFHYWRKPWRYLKEVLAATEKVYARDDQTIELDAPLQDVGNQMNHIKMSMLLSDRAAKEAEDKKNELVMYLAHDIRTPLTTVIGYLSLLQEAPDMPDDQREKYIGIALDKAERLEHLINELFDITRYHSQAVYLEKSAIDLNLLLAQVIDEFYPVMEETGNTTRLTADDHLTISGDPDKIARAFGNLLKNAAAYSDPNTEILITMEKHDDHAIITVQNDGPTIPPDQLNTIFDKFIRLDKSRPSDTGGAGLGLSIAKEIIELHNGEITVQSENHTIIFTVTLPIVA